MQLTGTIAHHVREVGEALEIGANQPFWLSEADSFWMVEQGTVDIFSVRKEKGRPDGRRRRLCRIRAGEFIFTLKPSDSDHSLSFLGVPGPDTCLIRINIAHLESMQKDPVLAEALAEAVDTWVLVLSASLSVGRLVPKYSQEIKEGQTLDLEPGLTVRCGAGTLWIVQGDGATRFLGRDDLSLIRLEYYVPLCCHTWLTAVEKTRLQAYALSNLLSQGIALMQCLAQFHALVFELTSLELEEVDSSERNRLLAGIDHDHKVAQSALGHLSAILGKDSVGLEATTSDPLFNACQIVGEAQGIKIARPVESAGILDLDDAVSRIAQASGFRTRTVKLKGKWWMDDHGPLLGTLSGPGSPVAILPDQKGRYHIHDPSSHSQVLVDAAVSETLESRAFVFCRPFPDGRLTPLSLFLFALAGHRKDIRLIIFLGLGSGLLATFVPVATGVLYDSVIPSSNSTLLFQMVAGLAAGSFVSAIFQLVQGLAQLRFLGGMEATLEIAVWDRLLNLPAVFFRRFSAGDLANRSSSVYQIQQYISGAVLASLLSGVFGSFNIALLFYYSPILGILGLAILFFSAVFLAVLLVMQLKCQTPQFELYGKIAGLNLQILTSISKLRANASELRAFKKWSIMYSRLKELNVKYRKLGMATSIFQTSLPLVISLATFGALAQMWNPDSPSMQTGQFLAFTAAMTAVIASVMSALSNLTRVLSVVPLYERMMPILEQEPETQTSKAYPGELTGAIEMAHVNFQYKPDEPVILKDVGFKADPGEFIALVGPSGSGKSTILRLLIGFETPGSGSIYYDGKMLAELDIQAVRRQLGVALQGGQVLSGTIFEAITGGSRLTMEDAWEAARMAAVDKDIEAMPMGMATVIGEQGAGLSGGQRQRLLIARAIVRKPRVVLFDEATSALDNISQAQVSESLEGLQATRIVIAHRLSTIRNADRIYVLVRGEVVESGPYSELMAKGGVFSELAKRQIA
jgi:NHLM bacteriocin system ABC transporter ATP-binding protein